MLQKLGLCFTGNRLFLVADQCPSGYESFTKLNEEGLLFVLLAGDDDGV